MDRGPANPESVARYFLLLAGRGSEPAPLTQLHLHKLLYYAQGWSLGMRDRPLFDGELQAWPLGPVVAELYGVFKAFGKDAIPFAEGSPGDELSADDRELIESVWKRYRDKSAFALSMATHAEAPWREARSGLGPKEPSNTPISRESLLRQFGEFGRWCREHGFEPESLWLSLEQARRGEVEEINLAEPTPRA